MNVVTVPTAPLADGVLLVVLPAAGVVVTVNMVTPVSVEGRPEVVIEGADARDAPDVGMDEVEVLFELDVDAPTSVPVPQGMLAPPGCVD